MIRWVAAGLVLATTQLPGLVLAQPITIEKATVPWSELERLFRREGRPVPEAPRGAAPTAWSMTAQVDGRIQEGRARLAIHLEISVLADRWVVAPLLPEHLAVSSAQVDVPKDRRGLLVRSVEGIAFAADGLGRYQLDLEVEGPLEVAGSSTRLAWFPPGLAGGKARIEVPGLERIAGRTGWSIERGPGGRTTALAALGASGLELLLPGAAERTEAGATLEELRALTVVSLGGAGVTRLTVRVLASEGELTLVLPQGARLWKAYVGGRALKASTVAQGTTVKVPVRGNAQVELAYTFDGQAMGIRGRFRVELPRLPVTVRDARWEVWLPAGLTYRETQAAMGPTACRNDWERTRTPLETQGACSGFSRAVLEPGRAYVEGHYEQPL
ncbi:MAG: hypothetical protein HY901_14265 [Deltaproteobacteria bacterium]|nr:hypothetical protein [Deltaproteobacteria bacterium]